MVRVASVAMALAVAATLGGKVGAAPSKGVDGHTHVHRGGAPHSIFDSDLARSFFESDWPRFERSSAGRESRGVENAHREQQNFLFLSGFDAWRHWAFAHLGTVWSPGGLDNEGFAFKLLVSGGAYRYTAGALNDATVIGRQYTLTAMPGWRFNWSGSIVTVFAGFDLQDFKTSPVDPGARLIGRHLGFRGAIELWHEPSSNSMLAMDASLTSIGAGNYARVAYGWRVFDLFYLGPEVQAYSTDQYRHARVGLHFTALKTATREWSGAIGWAGDNDHRYGAYVRINLIARR